MTKVETERRPMHRTTAWTYRCPARHQIVITVQGTAEPAIYKALFAGEHVACNPRDGAR